MALPKMREMNHLCCLTHPVPNHIPESRMQPNLAFVLFASRGEARDWMAGGPAKFIHD